MKLSEQVGNWGELFAEAIAKLESQVKTLSKVLIEDHGWTQKQIDHLLSP